ncbi:MAG: hypothetical protein JWN70_3955 [Planctomycetaceae bacterium]|nr:hypothetical protein [Planctomycetaceae bacterium]
MWQVSGTVRIRSLFAVFDVFEQLSYENKKRECQLKRFSIRVSVVLCDRLRRTKTQLGCGRCIAGTSEPDQQFKVGILSEAVEILFVRD